MICVGNVTVGGSGKSPFTAFLCRELFTLARRPVVLSRGYRGSISGPHLVRPEDSVGEVGDEALMHAEVLSALEIPVVIAKDRSAGAAFIAAENLGDVIVLDDGFQHRRLQRDLNILLLDISSEEARKRWSEGKLLPAGYLREHLEQALERTDAIVFMNRSTGIQDNAQNFASSAAFGSIPTFQFSLSPSHLIDVFSGERHELSKLEGLNASALTAIANPEHFFSMLEALGATLSSKVAYRDHHKFTESEWQTSRSSAGIVLSTEKDAVKLKPFLDKANQLYTLVLRARFAEDRQERAFFELVNRTLANGETPVQAS